MLPLQRETEGFKRETENLNRNQPGRGPKEQNVTLQERLRPIPSTSEVRGFERVKQL